MTIVLRKFMKISFIALTIISEGTVPLFYLFATQNPQNPILEILNFKIALYAPYKLVIKYITKNEVN